MEIYAEIQDIAVKNQFAVVAAKIDILERLIVELKEKNDYDKKKLRKMISELRGY